MYYKFYQIRQWLPKKQLFVVYKSLVESVLGYCISSWGGVLPTVSLPLNVAQRKVLKIIMFKNNRYSTEQLFIESTVLRVVQLYIKSIIRLLLNRKILINHVQHNIVTRNVLANNATTSYVTYSASQRPSYFNGPKIYNMLPTTLRTVEYRKAKGKIDNWLIVNNITI